MVRDATVAICSLKLSGINGRCIVP